MRLKLYIACLLGNILVSSSCNNDPIEVPKSTTSFVIINGDTCIQKEDGISARNGYTFAIELYSLKKKSTVNVTVYFKNQINSINQLVLEPNIICIKQEDSYFQKLKTEGIAKISSAKNNSIEIIFDQCRFGNNCYISGCFPSKIIQYITSETSINIWGDKHPLDQWFTGESRWEGNNLFNIQNTELIIYHPKNQNKPAPCVLICPGGAYTCLATFHEGTQVAKWFTDQGFAAAILHYCMPNGHAEIPLSDAQEAIRYLRKSCGNLKIDPNQIGVIGFSAGGHLASLLSTHFNITDGINVVNPKLAKDSRPDFTILCYPVITMNGSYVHIGSRNNLLGITPSKRLIEICSTEKQITSQTPPALLFHAENDSDVPIQNSQMYYEALLKNGINTKLIAFPTGKHGWGFTESYEYNDELKRNIINWLKNFVLNNYNN